MNYLQAAMAYHRQQLRALTYEEYLRTEHWKRTRRKALLRAGYQCQKCGATSYLEVHHVTYARLGAERPDDLIVLCRACHDYVHVARAGND